MTDWAASGTVAGIKALRRKKGCSQQTEGPHSDIVGLTVRETVKNV